MNFYFFLQKKSYFGFPLTTKSDLAVVKLIHYDQLGKCELTIKAEVNILNRL